MFRQKTGLGIQIEFRARTRRAYNLSIVVDSESDATQIAGKPFNAVDLSLLTSTANSIRSDGDSFGICRSASFVFP